MPRASGAGYVLQLVSIEPGVSQSTTRPIRTAPSAARAQAPKPASGKQEFRAGVRQERRRWATVLRSKAFLFDPKLAAHLLTESSQSASEIVAYLRRRRADAIAAAEARQAVIAERWQRAFERVSTQCQPTPARTSLDAAFARVAAAQ